MGSFSWLKADNLTSVANVVDGQVFKFLIPSLFGGGFVEDQYQDYGYLGQKKDGSPKYDMYELLAFWNNTAWWNGKERACMVRNALQYDGDKFPYMKEIDDYTSHNRSIGIDIGCHNSEIDALKYPLKLVSPEFNGTYESCLGRSYSDPNQGWAPIFRNVENSIGDTVLILRMNDWGCEATVVDVNNSFFEKYTNSGYSECGDAQDILLMVKNFMKIGD